MKIFGLLLALVSGNLFAVDLLDMREGDWGSGGGNGLVCFSSKDVADAVKANKYIVKNEHLKSIESIEVYDLYEAKKRRGLSSDKPEIIEIGESEEFYDYFDRLSKRFKNHNDLMAELVNMAKSLVPDSNIIFNNAAVKNQNDLGNVTLPQDKCLIITMAAQVNYFEHYQVHIDERLFFHPRHSKQSQATLVLHELFYAIGRKHFKHSDSGSTRSLLRYLISYHSSVTEGSVSRALVDLNFSNGELGDTGINTRLAHSETIIELVEEFRFNLRQHGEVLLGFDFSVGQEMGRNLYGDVRKQGQSERWFDDWFSSRYSFEKQQSIPMIEDIIEKGFEETSDMDIWIDFNSRLTELYNQYSLSVDESEKFFQSTLRFNLVSSRPHLKKEQVENIISKTMILVHELRIDPERSGDRSGYFNKHNYYIAMRDSNHNSRYVRRLLRYLDSEICTGDTEVEVEIPGPTEISKNNEDEICFDPLKLNNRIPRT